MMQGYEALLKYFKEFRERGDRETTHLMEVWRVLYMGRYTEHEEFMKIEKTNYEADSLRVEFTFADGKQYVVEIKEKL